MDRPVYLLLVTSMVVGSGYHEGRIDTECQTGCQAHGERDGEGVEGRVTGAFIALGSVEEVYHSMSPRMYNKTAEMERQ